MTLKDVSFKTFSRQTRLDAPTHLVRDIYRAAADLARQLWKPPARLRSMTVTALYVTETCSTFQQLDLLDSTAQACGQRQEQLEEAVARLYREQSEEHFWSLMNALNYALELQTKVLVPLDAAVDPQSGAAPWAHLPIPEDRAEGLPPWLLHARKERHYLPLFTSVKNAEAEKASATRPMVERSLRSAMEYALETDGIDGVVLDPWTSSATLDVSLLSGLLRSERGSDNPGAQELEAGHAAARAGDWQEAAARYTAAAEAGSAEALSALGDCLYYGRGTRKNKTQARRMWKKAAQAGEVQAMIALGDDCAASGGEMAETLQYYRRAQSAAREVPDIAYTPQVCLRLAQYETQYLSRKKALLQVAEAVQGFRILQAEGETDAADWLREAELLTDQLLADDKNA